MILSANLGFLFTELDLPARVLAARAAGFDAVEFHDQPQQAGPALRSALAQAGLPVLALNTFMGPGKGRAALCAEGFAQDFAEAERAAAGLGARAIHVTAGLGGQRDIYLASLTHALRHTMRVVLIEPLCPQAVPGYHLASLAQAEAVLAQCDHPRLKLMFDWYHIANELGVEGALAALARLGPRIGHVQLARPGDRGAPVPEHLPELGRILAVMRRLGLGAVGLEYVPDGPVGPVVAAIRGM